MPDSPPLPTLLEGLAPETFRDHLTWEQSPGPGPFFRINASGIAEASATLGCSARESMIRFLEKDVWPNRFCRNRGLFSGNEQANLLRAHVVVLGCGGLGGHVITLLARFGTGRFTVCDHDDFDESNLNRQTLCREDRIGTNKAEAAQAELRLIASHAEVRAVNESATPHTLPAMLVGADVLVDCLDNPQSRLAAETAAAAAGVPFVHGSIAGLEGFALCRPGKATGSALAALYPDSGGDASRAEHKLGVPTPTPALIAILQVMLTIRVLTGKFVPGNGAQEMWHADLSVPELERLFL